MNAKDHVEFTGMIPKEMSTKKNMKGKLPRRPFYGVIQSIKGDIAIVKPKSQRFTVKVNVTQLTVVDEDKTAKKQKNPRKKRNTKKSGASRPAIKAIVKKAGEETSPAVPTPVAEEPTPEPKLKLGEVLDAIKPDVEEPCVTAKEIHDVPVKPEDAFKETPPPIPAPKIVVEGPTPEEESSTNWVKDDLINKPKPIAKAMDDYDAGIDPYDEYQSNGDLLIYMVIAIITCALIGSYLLFF